jgi:hypothetical protein
VVQLLFIAHEELLNALDFFFELDGDLIDLSALHVIVIDLIASDWRIYSFFLVSQDHLVLSVVPLHKLIDHEFLHRNDVNDVKLGFDVVEDQNAQLIGDAAVAEIGENEEHR